MTNVATDLLGKMVSVYEWIDTFSARSHRRVFTGIVRAVTFGDYHPHRTEPAFHLLVETVTNSGLWDQDVPVGTMLLASINDRMFVVVEPERP